ncbi:hypothetical protein [Melittangium boletus]|uniref:hypothetical protein n=1 Tax=Melittangium boletus TaxID=83453 RepID=UPI003DA23575
MAQVQLRIALWHGEAPLSAPKHLLEGDFDTRLGAVKTALKVAREQWLDAGSGGSLPVLKIFVGPEGVLVKSDDEAAIGHDQFKLEAAGLKEASEGLLFIPGTVIWKKPAVKTSGEVPVNRLDGIESKLKRYHQRGLDFSGKKNLSYSPQTHTLVGDARVSEVTKKLTKLRADWTHGENVFIVRNVAYAYYEKTQLLKYYKQAEYKLNRGRKTGEFTQKDKEQSKAIKFIPGHEEGVFTVPLTEDARIRCGVEICADHYDGQLKHSATGGGVDLHFLLSDFSYTYANSVAVREGGYIIHASTARSESGVYTHDLNALARSHSVDPLDPSQSKGKAAGTLSFYAVTLEV